MPPNITELKANIAPISMKLFMLGLDILIYLQKQHATIRTVFSVVIVLSMSGAISGTASGGWGEISRPWSPLASPLLTMLQNHFHFGNVENSFIDSVPMVI